MTFTPLASSSHGNAYVVSDGVTSILLECGLSFKKMQKAMDYNLAGISACLVSHEHKDHAGCYMDLIKSGIPVFASEGTMEALNCDLIQTLEERQELRDAGRSPIRNISRCRRAFRIPDPQPCGW